MTVNKLIGINKEQEEIEFNRIKELAEKGDTESQYSMGLHCLYAEDEPANYKEAEKWLWLAAEQGHCDAQYDLGCLYLFGKGVRKDFEEAIDWLKKSVANGNPTYQFRLGYAYFCHGDYCEAAKWIRLSAEQGEQYAQVSLGSLYLHGTGVIKDEEEAMKWFRLAAKQGNKNAKFEVRKYNRRKAGLPEETEGCENITSTLYHPDSEKMEIDSESFSSKAKEIQEFFVENGIPMTFK